MWIEPVTLTGRAVRLEPLTPGHAPALFRAAEPGLFRLTPQQEPPEWSVAGFERDTASVLAMTDTVAFAIVELASGEVAGRTTFMDIRPQHLGLEIGRTWITPRLQGTAVNPESKYLLMRHAFEVLGARRVQLKTGHENIQSQRAMAKLGAVREGVLRNHMIEPGGRMRDTVMFAVIDSDWPRVKAGLEARLGYAP